MKSQIEQKGFSGVGHKHETYPDKSMTCVRQKYKIWLDKMCVLSYIIWKLKITSTPNTHVKAMQAKNNLYGSFEVRT